MKWKSDKQEKPEEVKETKCSNCAFRIKTGCFKKLAYYSNPSGVCTGYKTLREKVHLKNGTKPKVSGNDQIYAVFYP